jgi:hypothetical protein
MSILRRNECDQCRGEENGSRLTFPVCDAVCDNHMSSAIA